MSEKAENRTGRQVLPALAEIYPQLYLAPGQAGAEEAYRRIVAAGQDAPEHSLSHFHTDQRDTLTKLQTPAGPVMAVTLHERADFELFLRIMAHRCSLAPIPPTQGAAILDGVINWSRIRDHQHQYLLEHPAAGWPDEFRRFTTDKRHYTDALIVLSAGPYSAIPAALTGLAEEEWLRASLTIRQYHECTHFICRRMFPDRIDALWDELVADAAGLFAAFGRYEPARAELFLGIHDGRYTGGRLENYVPDGDDKPQRLQTLAGQLHRAIIRIDGMILGIMPKTPYELAIRLEERKFPLA